MKKALAIICYNRPDYFELFWLSVTSQVINDRPLHETYDIYLFQDGLWEGEPVINKDNHQRVTQLVSRLPENVKIFHQKENLGVALHFDFIEKHLFQQAGYDFVAFCEDDLILAPGYMSVIDMMANKFHDDPRVGMVSAHPGNPTVPLEQQKSNRHKYAAMDHNWGFGLTRSFWEKRQPLVECYLDLIRSVPYRKRPEKVIFEWLRAAGFNPAASSQDYIKSCATFALGALKLSTFPNFGLPIGRTGLHCSPELFKKMGFDRTVVFDEELDMVGDLDQEQFLSLYKKGEHHFLKKKDRSVSGPERFNSDQWKIKLNSGELHPRRLIPDFFLASTAEANAIDWKWQDIPVRPQMESESLDLLQTRLRNAGRYLEYGGGGSTVLAASLGVTEIHSVGSDKRFLEAIQKRVIDSQPVAKVITHYVDIGPTKELGLPVDASCAGQWPRYCSGAWDTLTSQGLSPDLIFVNGRFRVACFLTALLLAKRGTIILFNDYVDRPHYHVVEKYILPHKTAGRIAEFIVENPISPQLVLTDLLAFSTEFA
ncbi:Glycosyl transferase family 2 [Collimonas sp. OK307]|uniref:glycosyltransferase n=1 Tax=Collimonas sp. OK307 TaxID=1801620 RepID=UPI0008DF734D|nr:glycosyltransferase [Collimonas sp. OK307]SFI17827.1 Glycosyl transferase family 2 [Collimonas sp. OK307]